MTTMAFSSHEDYFETVAPELRPGLEAIQAMVESQLTQATSCIGYGMPAFRGKRIFSLSRRSGDTWADDAPDRE